VAYFLNQHIIARKHHKERVMIFNRDTQQHIFVDHSGAYLLRLLLQGLSIQEVANHCQKEFEFISSEQAYQEIKEFVEQLLHSGWLVDLSDTQNERDYIRGESLDTPIDLVFLELTNRCNLSCLHCYMNAENHPKEPPAIDWISFIDKLDQLGVMKLVVTGGEPTLHPQFEQILKEIKKRKMGFALFTNGTTLTSRRVDLLEEVNPEYVAISLDGADAETHNHFRRAIAFDKTIQGIKFLTNKGIKVRINITLNHRNEMQLEDIIRIASALKVHEIRAESYSECGRGQEYFTERLGYRIGKVVDNRIKKELASLKDENLHVPRYGKSLDAEIPEWETDEVYPVCGVGRSIFLVKGNGNVTLCTLLNEDERFIAGNVLKTPVEEIWNQSAAFDELRNHNISDTGCFGCHAKNVCHGGCKARAFFAYGSFQAPDPWNCSIHDGKGNQRLQ
jgi:radical SAM protein with 4Fe4S-binding SPASM domain